VTKTVRATLRGLRYVHGNKDDAVAIISAYYKIEKDLARAAYDVVVDTFPKDGLPTKGAIENTIETAKPKEPSKASDAVDFVSSIGVPERDRKAFLFTNVTDAHGRHFNISVAVSHLAATRAIYVLGMQCDPDRIAERWSEAIESPIAPIFVTDGPMHEEVHMG
jgi:hypothetical protein